VGPTYTLSSTTGHAFRNVVEAGNLSIVKLNVYAIAHRLRAYGRINSNNIKHERLRLTCATVPVSWKVAFITKLAAALEKGFQPHVIQARRIPKKFTADENRKNVRKQDKQKNPRNETFCRALRKTGTFWPKCSMKRIRLRPSFKIVSKETKQSHKQLWKSHRQPSLRTSRFPGPTCPVQCRPRSCQGCWALRTSCWSPASNFGNPLDKAGKKIRNLSHRLLSQKCLGNVRRFAKTCVGSLIGNTNTVHGLRIGSGQFRLNSFFLYSLSECHEWSVGAHLRSLGPWATRLLSQWMLRWWRVNWEGKNILTSSEQLWDTTSGSTKRQDMPEILGVATGPSWLRLCLRHEMLLATLMPASRNQNNTQNDVSLRNQRFASARPETLVPANSSCSRVWWWGSLCALARGRAWPPSSRNPAFSSP